MATKKYRVALETTLSVTVDVEVEYDETDEEQSMDNWLTEQAIEKAYEENGFYLCHQCSGSSYRGDKWSADVGEFEVADKWGTKEADVEEIS